MGQTSRGIPGRLSFPLVILAIGAIGAWFPLGATPCHARELSFEDRVQAQRAIEEVYWRHRIWPEANPEPKPALSAVLPDEELRARVEDSLKRSNALAELWGRPITSEQLQAEMERMGRDTHSPQILRELFAALDNDPALIAETLVRQKLVDRRIRDAYGNDPRIHADVRRRAEAARARSKSFADLRRTGAEYEETTWSSVGSKERALGLSVDADERTELRRQLAEKVGALEETPDAFVVTAVVAAASDERTTATVTWRKERLDE